MLQSAADLFEQQAGVIFVTLALEAGKCLGLDQLLISCVITPSRGAFARRAERALIIAMIAVQLLHEARLLRAALQLLLCKRSGLLAKRIHPMRGSRALSLAAQPKRRSKRALICPSAALGSPRLGVKCDDPAYSSALPEQAVRNDVASTSGRGRCLASYQRYCPEHRS